ncbi:PREDICTED: coiled-coil domain-containing protein 125 [Nanorana parkeri]|uniref:coiled-coil domain-containing protein 125 n=1 Tax=Nanorana parkeri TaxID=125878 RepID=UPI00085491C1|nr:PREDICTED: coiled-coil domain-containing protein 125 [Nanorana parkeri]
MCDTLANEHGCPSEEEEDFMAGGDLGEGFGRKPGGLYEAIEGTMARTLRLKKGSDAHGHYHLVKKGDDVSSVRCHGGKYCNSEDRSVLRPSTEGYVRCRQNSIDASSEVSSEDLRQRLQDLTEEVDLLRVELEASQRQLDGKDEALKILQSMAVFDKATGHTKEMLQKAGEHRRSLEKEINVLQWEIEFDQVRLKNLEESWKEKYERVHCENAALKESLELRTNEVKTLKAENTIISQQCQELLAMLDVKHQKMFQDNMSLDKSSLAEVTALELAVLGACTCTPGGEPCSCAKMSAATRKQLLQLREECELEKKSKEEAYVMADAFRIAFEQQLKRRNNDSLPLSDIEKLCKKGSKRINSWRRLKEDGYVLEKTKNMTLGQKLKSMLISSIDSTHLDAADDPQKVLAVLIDLLNDKEEALAHQRKVSYMLARTIEDKVESSANHKKSSSQKEFAAISDNHNCFDTEVPCLCVPNTTSDESHGTKQEALRSLETSFSLLLKDVYPQQKHNDKSSSDQGTQPKEEESQT